MAQQPESLPEGIVGLMLRLRGIGIVDPQFLKIVESVPHEQFVPVQFFDKAWRPHSLPIACGQTMLSPDATIRMVEALGVADSHTVLEIGTGTGYQTALLARMAKKVHSVDRYKTLIDAAGERLQRVGLTNATLDLADGNAEISGQGLYDRIICDLAYPGMPRLLLEQMVSGGKVVTIIGEAGSEQMVVRLTKIGSRFERENLFPIRAGSFETGLAMAL